MKISTKQIATTGLFIAILGVMTAVPSLGFIALPVINIGIILIPAIIACQVTDFKSSLLVCTSLGIFSLINSYFRPTGLLSFALQNPLVSIFPRIVIAVTTFFSYKFFSNKFEGKKSKFVREKLPATFSAAVGITTNTVLLLSMVLVLYYGKPLNNGGVVSLPILGAIILTNYIPEVILASVLVPLVTSAVRKLQSN